MSGHPDQTLLFYILRDSYYYPSIYTDAATTVPNVDKCESNGVRIKLLNNLMLLFQATRPFECIALGLLCPLIKLNTGFQYALVFVDRFSKLTQVVPLRLIDAYVVSIDFVEHWVFKYGVPKTVLFHI